MWSRIALSKYVDDFICLVLFAFNEALWKFVARTMLQWRLTGKLETYPCVGHVLMVAATGVRWVLQLVYKYP